MLGGGNDYLGKKAQQLGLGRQYDLEFAQQVLERLYPGQARAVKIMDHKITVITPSAPVASDLRLRQVELIKLFNAKIRPPLRLVLIKIRGF